MFYMVFIIGTYRAKHIVESWRKNMFGVMAPLKPAFNTSASDICVAQYLTHITQKHIMDCTLHWDLLVVHDIISNRTSTTKKWMFGYPFIICRSCKSAWYTLQQFFYSSKWIFSIIKYLVNLHDKLSNSTFIPELLCFAILLTFADLVYVHDKHCNSTSIPEN